MGRLDDDISAAIESGMSYGKWKAMQPVKNVEGTIPEGWIVCEYCGKAFQPKTRRKQRFCEVECQRAAYKEKTMKG